MLTIDNIHKPKIVTKTLSINTVFNRKKVRISSNFLAALGYEAGMRIQPKSLGKGNGFVIRPDELGSHQVYQRTYKNRKRSNNPMETVIEFASQELINKSFYSYTNGFHAEMQRGQILITPALNHAFEILKRAKRYDDPFRSLVMMTGGVDVYEMELCGFRVSSVLDYRPPEKRDFGSNGKFRDLTEVNVLNTLVNAKPDLIMNEDIYSLDMQRLERLLAETGAPVNVMHISLQCDDHSNLKSKSNKDRSIAELSSTFDMCYPVLKAIEAVKPSCILIENVHQFASSGAGVITELTLRRLGYQCHVMTLDARDFEGIQSRKRYYLVATVFPGFEPPQPTPRRTDPIWPLIEPYLDECRDVTDCSYVQGRETYHRSGPADIDINSCHSGTITKSQDRTRDAIFIRTPEGRILKPSERVIKILMSIPDSFDCSWMGKECATELLGQSIDGAMHRAVLKQLHQHLQTHCKNRGVIKFDREIHADNSGNLDLF